MKLPSEESSKSATYNMRYEFYIEAMHKQAYWSYKTHNYFYKYANDKILNPNYS